MTWIVAVAAAYIGKETPMRIEILKHQYEQAKATCAEFAKKVEKDPFEALSWVNTPIEAAARIRVYGAILRNVEKGVSDSDLLALAKDRLAGLVTSGQIKSTAALAGALHAEEMRAWAAVVTTIETDGNGHI